MNTIRRGLKILSIFGLIFYLNNCTEKKNGIIPNVPVNLYFNINDPEFIHLAVPGNSLPISGGVNGIVVYRVSVDDFVAFDRTCTYQPEDNCAVKIDNAVAECPCCSSKFFLIDGAVFEGPATYPLKPYRVLFDGTNVRITN